MRLATLSTKGVLQVFKVKAQMSLDSLTLDTQVNIADFVKS
jgi:hypothetical protein